MNVHYGKIGDVWKHLPLAEILSIERPAMYWDAYAGSAGYPLTHSWERDYGIFHFMERAEQSPDLRNSSFLQLLTGLRDDGGEPTIYPGSPGLAMTLLGYSAEYLFCDTDPQSIDSIRLAARAKGLSDAKAKCVLGDGAATIHRTLSQLPDQSLASLFVLIDPYDPFRRSEGGIHAADLFFRIVSKGAKAMLWYGWDTSEMRERVHAQFRESLHSQGPIGSPSYWCGEIALVAAQVRDTFVCPGVTGCGILCGNLSDASVRACTRLGEGLAVIYREARLPRNCAGAIEFLALPPLRSAPA
jgi:23S rRNA (adenine2030-N6)-methyltransferase